MRVRKEDIVCDLNGSFSEKDRRQVKFLAAFIQCELTRDHELVCMHGSDTVRSAGLYERNRLCASSEQIAFRNKRTARRTKQTEQRTNERHLADGTCSCEESRKI